MSIDLSQFIPSFLEESFEGLELMESSLLTLQPGDTETINSIFRAAHSIKGGAGTFGFNKVTEFTHLVETLLDEMRDGRRDIIQSDIEILLKSVDCIKLLIESARDDEEIDESEISRTSHALEQSLAQEQSVNTIESIEQESPSNAAWSVSFIPEHHLVKTGNDPLLLFNALADLGDIQVFANTSEVPSLLDIDPEELYVSWQISLDGDTTEQEIHEIFEWVEDDCKLDIKQDAASLHRGINQGKIDEVTCEATQSATPINEDEFDSNAGDEPLTVLKLEQANNQANPEKVPAKLKQEVSSIRVGVDKVDTLINLVGELVITQSMLSELGNDFDMKKLDRLTSGLEQLLQNTKELQESVMRIRMLPISFAFNRFPRLVHDLANKTGKEIELIIKGEQTELDKTVMEQIGDPLVHLVRNAGDHGIEAPDIRIKNGKSATGTIILDAYHLGGNIVIEISDDGAGINKEVVFNKAVEKGIIDPNATLTDSQIYDLLFEPGFSTAKTISDISGRGVGMDVVKRNIQALGGRIQIESQLGKGSIFKVNLPLTLAILDGQLVKVGSETYIIPLIAIVESLQVDPSHINKVSGDIVLYRLREDNVPVIPIYKLFKIDAKQTLLEDALLIVVEADGQKVGLMVDDLLAQQQVVIKSLEDNYQQVQGISGATILGDGSVAMILDIAGIIQMATEHTQRRHQSGIELVTLEGDNG